MQRSIKDKGLIDKIRMSTRPDYINDYILSYLKSITLVDIIELGVQSLDEKFKKKERKRGHEYRKKRVLSLKKNIK